MPLRKIALDCLEVEASLRPSAIRLCAMMEDIQESQAYQGSEALAATPGRLQIAPALTEDDLNLDNTTSAQTLEIQDKPQVSGQLQGECHTNREVLEKRIGSLQGSSSALNSKSSKSANVKIFKGFKTKAHVYACRTRNY